MLELLVADILECLAIASHLDSEGVDVVGELPGIGGILPSDYLLAAGRCGVLVVHSSSYRLPIPICQYAAAQLGSCQSCAAVLTKIEKYHHEPCRQ